jgi:uncharacterized protein with gpF-like domain
MLKSHGTPLVRVCGCIATALQADVVPFSSDPQEAIDFLKNKVDMPSATWTDLWEAEHSIAFTVAGAQSDALVSDFHDAINEAIANGETLDDFRKNFDQIVEDYGWDYNGSRNWRSRVIFDTNMSTAYAAGRWDQIQAVKDTRPYLRYVHLERQAHPRPLHEAWDGTILAVDHPWWLTHYPPNGWFCHCTVQSLSDDDLDRYGWSVSDQAPDSPLVDATIKTSDGSIQTVQVPEGIDAGFAYRPGAMPDALGGDDGGDDGSDH